MLTPVMTGDAPTTTPTPTETPTAPVEEVIETVTFENVLDLEIGKTYRMRPYGYALSGEGFDSTVTELFFSSVNQWDTPVKLFEGIPAGTRPVDSTFILDPKLYAQTPDGLSVLGSYEDGGYDEIVIEIKAKTEVSEKTSSGGRGGDPFTYHIVQYDAVAIENLTNPDYKFEYE